MIQRMRHREHPQDAWRSTHKTHGLPRRASYESLLAKTLLIGVSALMMGCLDQTSIQTDYVSERNNCQGDAESKINAYSDEIAADDVRAKNAKLVTLFSDCMFARGWSVATPTREAPKPGSDNPLEAARKAPDPSAQPAQAAPVQAAPAQPAPVYQPQTQPQQQAPIYYQQVPATAPQQPLISPQQKIAPNVQQQPPVYYQQVPTPAPAPIYAPQQQAPIYYQQVPEPVYYQQVPTPQGYVPQPVPAPIAEKPNASNSTGPE